MKHAETVTFGGSSLDRAGEIRTDTVAVETALQNPDARAILFWRGKPFIYDPAPEYSWSLLYLSVIGTVLVFPCYLTLLNRIGLAKAGYASIMIPVVAVILSVMFEGLALTPTLMGGLILVLAGNVFILTRTK